MVISWDFPIVQFGSGRKWYRHYTDFYGTNGHNSWAIARDGLKNATSWSEAIDAWQARYINDESQAALVSRHALQRTLRPRRSRLASTAAPSVPIQKPRPVYSFMECYDYPYYETLDVRFYGSMPLLKFWPELEKNVMREFAATVPQESPEKMEWIWKTQATDELDLPHSQSKRRSPARSRRPDRKILSSKSINSVGKTPMAGKI